MVLMTSVVSKPRLSLQSDSIDTPQSTKTLLKERYADGLENKVQLFQIYDLTSSMLKSPASAPGQSDMNRSHLKIKIYKMSSFESK